MMVLMSDTSIFSRQGYITPVKYACKFEENKSEKKNGARLDTGSNIGFLAIKGNKFFLKLCDPARYRTEL